MTRYCLKINYGDYSEWQWVARDGYDSHLCESLEDARAFPTMQAAFAHIALGGFDGRRGAVWEIRETAPLWFPVPRERYRRRFQRRYLFSGRTHDLACDIALGETLEHARSRVLVRNVS